MSNIDGLGIGPTPTLYGQNNKAEFLADQAKIDLHYDEHVQSMKSIETLSKGDFRQSANPMGMMLKLKISDDERSKLADVASLNGWSRQDTEGMYKMYIADSKGEGSIGEFLKGLTAIPPGYYGEHGETMLGLTEADRRKIMDLPPAPETSSSADEIVDVQTNSIDASQKSETAKSIASAAQVMNTKLIDDEKSALSNLSQINGVDEQSAASYYKMYLAQHAQPSMADFIQLLTQNAPNAYGKDGGLKQNNDDESQVIRVTT